MKKKIFRSILTVAVAVFTVSIVIIMGVLYSYFGSIQERQLTDELLLAATAVEKNGMEYLEALDSQRYRLTWVAEDGSVLYDTQADESTMENHADREEIREAMESREGVSSRYSTTLLEHTLYSARRLNDGSVLRISSSRATIWILALGMFQSIAIILIFALILSGVLADRLAKRIVKPLNQLDLEHPLENDTYEELSPLLRRMDKQHRQIDTQLMELRRKTDEFTQITGNMREGLVLLNEKGVILNINAAAKNLFHATPTCIGADFLSVERSHEISLTIEKAMAEGHSQIHFERDGRAYQLDVSRIESDGAVVGAVLLAFDVTEEAFAERSRREFTANVSHELKTPLQSIMGSAELIENGLVKPEDMPRFVGHIRTEAGRLVTLIEDIIRLSQLDEGDKLPFDEVDLLEAANEVAASLQDAATAKRVSLGVSGEAVTIQSVRRLITESLFNLCDNAIKYNVEGGAVKISVCREGEQAVLTVRDTGIGIPPEYQERVFERFYRVDKSRSKETGGTGLGLSIVKHSVQYLGGHICLESTPGQGTAVTIILPTAIPDPELDPE